MHKYITLEKNQYIVMAMNELLSNQFFFLFRIKLFQNLNDFIFLEDFILVKIF